MRGKEGQGRLLGERRMPPARSRAGQDGRGSESRAGWALICTRTPLALGNNTNTIMSSTYILPNCEMQRCDHEIQIAPVEGGGETKLAVTPPPPSDHGLRYHATTSTRGGLGPHPAATLSTRPRHRDGYIMAFGIECLRRK